MKKVIFRVRFLWLRFLTLIKHPINEKWIWYEAISKKEKIKSWYLGTLYVVLRGNMVLSWDRKEWKALNRIPWEELKRPFEIEDLQYQSSYGDFYAPKIPKSRRKDVSSNPHPFHIDTSLPLGESEFIKKVKQIMGK